MKIIQSFLTNNPCYKAGKKITVKGLMLHSVGCSQPNASVFIKLWNKPDFTNACVHAFIDGNTGDVHQTLPWDHLAGHCYKGVNGSGNNTHIGVEMCEPACITYKSGSNFTCSNVSVAREVVKRTYDSAVELFAYLCKEFNLDPLADGVIISHAEGYKRGIASNHGDPEHIWKQLNMGYTMDTFRQAVSAAMKDDSSGDTQTTDVLYCVQVGAFRNPDNANDLLAKIKKAGFDGFITTKPAVSEPAPVKKSVEELAREVIRGLWGSGAERKEKLTAAGYDYNEVQKKVNQLL